MHEMQNVARIDKCVKEVSGRVTVECKDTIVCLQGFGPVLSAIVAIMLLKKLYWRHLLLGWLIMKITIVDVCSYGAGLGET